MDNKIKMLRVWRCDKISQNVKKMAQISVYESGLCIKLYDYFNDFKFREQCCVVYIYSYHTYIYAMSTLVAHGITLKLAKKLEVLLNSWYELGYFSFPNEGEIVVDFSKINSK